MPVAIGIDSLVVLFISFLLSVYFRFGFFFSLLSSLLFQIFISFLPYFQLVFDILSLRFPHVFIWLCSRTEKKKREKTSPFPECWVLSVHQVYRLQSQITSNFYHFFSYPIVCTSLSVREIHTDSFIFSCFLCEIVII